MDKKIKIAVVGSGYVGMSLATLLSQHNNVVVYDINPSRVTKINNKESTVVDVDIERFLSIKNLSLSATLDKNVAFKDAEYIIIATPTNYDTETNYFDTSAVDEVIKDIRNINNNALVIIKSTVPVGHTDLLQKKYNTESIIFSPEFLRENLALHDNLFPSRIIIGSKTEAAKSFCNLLLKASKKDNTKTLFMRSTEAEAVKLFANTFLAMRISFFNELDSYAFSHDLDTKNIIKGVCLDDRIGDGYNNPSFGYGGYCLPKDTKQLLANFNDIPQTLIKAIVTSNEKRKEFISKEIIKLNPRTIGIYRLIMKKNSHNFRSSSIQGIIQRLKDKGIKIFIYEPTIDQNLFDGLEVIHDLDKFKKMSELILANRKDSELLDVNTKCFSRDLFERD